MTKKGQFDELEWHRKTAVKLFNATWDLIDKKDRTIEDNDEMIHSAHSSRYHWGQVVSAGVPDTGPINLERGEWQISRVYSILNRPHAAMYHAQRCIDICEENTIGDFDLAFAYESMARACAIMENKEQLEKYLTLAKEAGEKIEKEDINLTSLVNLKLFLGIV